MEKQTPQHHVCMEGRPEGCINHCITWITGNSCLSSMGHPLINAVGKAATWYISGMGQKPTQEGIYTCHGLCSEGL